MATVIKNGQVYFGGTITPCDLLIENGCISAIGQNLNAEHVIDAAGKLVSPGLVDMHVHYRDPGQTAKEDVHTGTLAAARGGFTTTAAMPNVTPVPNTPALMQKMVANNQQNGVVHVLQYGPITVDEVGEALPDYAGLKSAGAIALSNDGKGVQNAQTMLRAMRQAKDNQLIIAEHAQDDTLFNSGVINAGSRATEFALRPITELAETTQIARDLLLAAKTGVHYHVCHVSTKTSVDLIRIAKKRGVHVTCEAAPHHLLLTEDDIDQNDSNFKMNPPLRTEEDRQALIAGLLDGTIDMIATDHAPHTRENKAGGFAKSAFGITGSETAFSELYTQLVKTGYCSLTQLLAWLTIKPAMVFGLQHAGKIAIGEPADLAIFDLQAKTRLQTQNYFSKSSNTPFTGDNVYGSTVLTMVAGQVVYQAKEQQ
ncbi:dihydroorotase [Lactobacillus sp. ESL0731]|uniref:dihydroorotase n=1 Tax=unclassified Lactobacillus TaxID=2620435 RepID=UPI0023F98677|nr:MULTISPECIES: dihydroorotase [unclassified Lactobacillus]WEV50524.1 dihydroorotase [Lactobacillus sp. ESL0700]WEV61654.1 dihydroorotase [Lactobacillus sp. ESL0731]